MVTDGMILLTWLTIFRRPYAGEELYRVTDVMALLTSLLIFRRPRFGEELYRVTDVMALLRTSGRSTREMHAGGMKFTAAFQLVRQTSFFPKDKL